MDNIVYIVALVLGALMLLSVCYVYVKHQVLQLGGMALAGLAVILVGMSVWQSFSFSITQDGLVAQGEKAIKVAEEAKVQAAEAKAQVAEARVAMSTLTKRFDALRLASPVRVQPTTRPR